jgi:hypothetical protein
VTNEFGPSHNDDIVHLNVEIIGSEREPRNEPGLKDHACSPGVGGFRLEARVAPEESLVLGRRVGDDVSVLGGRDTRQLALRKRRCGWIAALVRAGVGVARQSEALWEEELDDVGRANRPVVARPEPHVPDRSEARFELVRVGAEGVRANVIRRFTIGAIKAQLIDDVMFDDRNLEFGERLANVEMTGDRRGRAALASKIAAREFLVNFEVQ